MSLEQQQQLAACRSDLMALGWSGHEALSARGMWTLFKQRARHGGPWQTDAAGEIEVAVEEPGRSVEQPAEEETKREGAWSDFAAETSSAEANSLFKWASTAAMAAGGLSAPEKAGADDEGSFSKKNTEEEVSSRPSLSLNLNLTRPARESQAPQESAEDARKTFRKARRASISQAEQELAKADKVCGAGASCMRRPHCCPATPHALQPCRRLARTCDAQARTGPVA